MNLAQFVAAKLPSAISSSSYLPCASCWAHCEKEGTPGEPCWGRVLYNNNYANKRRHFCAGHDDPTTYRPKGVP
jgi:hypothetical protein